MLQYLLLIVLAYLGYRYFSWPGAAVVVVAWFGLGFLYRTVQARASRDAAVQVISKPLSDSEKQHLSDMRERDQRMAEREAAKSRYGR